MKRRADWYRRKPVSPRKHLETLNDEEVHDAALQVGPFDQ